MQPPTIANSPRLHWFAASALGAALSVAEFALEGVEFAVAAEFAVEGDLLWRRGLSRQKHTILYDACCTQRDKHDATRAMILVEIRVTNAAQHVLCWL